VGIVGATLRLELTLLCQAGFFFFRRCWHVYVHNC